MKRWYTSKTLWLNVLALIAIVVQLTTGNDTLNPEAQGAVLAVINMVLRIITNTQIDWSGK